MNTRIKSSKIKLTGIILALWMCLLSTIALANHFTDQVKVQLAAGALVALGEDYQFTHEPYIDSIQHGQTDMFNLNLHSGTSYTMLGVCDVDCKDIDLRLYDENDNLIDSDMGGDDYPTVKVTPKWTAKFRLVVIMNQCHNSPCAYGIGVFGK